MSQLDYTLMLVDPVEQEFSAVLVDLELHDATGGIDDSSLLDTTPFNSCDFGAFTAGDYWNRPAPVEKPPSDIRAFRELGARKTVHAHARDKRVMAASHFMHSDNMLNEVDPAVQAQTELEEIREPQLVHPPVESPHDSIDPDDLYGHARVNYDQERGVLHVDYPPPQGRETSSVSTVPIFPCHARLDVLTNAPDPYELPDERTFIEQIAVDRQFRLTAVSALPTGPSMGISWENSGWKDPHDRHSEEAGLGQRGINPSDIDASVPSITVASQPVFVSFCETGPPQSAVEMAAELARLREEVNAEVDREVARILREQKEEAEKFARTGYQSDSDSGSEDEYNSASDSAFPYSDSEDEASIPEPRRIAPLPGSASPLSSIASLRSSPRSISSSSPGPLSSPSAYSPTPKKTQKRKATRPPVVKAPKKAAVLPKRAPVPPPRPAPKKATVAITRSNPSYTEAAFLPPKRALLSYPPSSDSSDEDEDEDEGYVPTISQTAHPVGRFRKSAARKAIVVHSSSTSSPSSCAESAAPSVKAPAKDVAPGATYLPSGRVLCNLDNCKHTTGNMADMGRHREADKHKTVRTLFCPGCPMSFTRKDAEKRHALKNRPHLEAPRKKLLKTWLALESTTKASDKFRATFPDVKSYNKAMTNLFDVWVARQKA